MLSFDIFSVLNILDDSNLKKNINMCPRWIVKTIKVMEGLAHRLFPGGWGQEHTFMSKTTGNILFSQITIKTHYFGPPLAPRPEANGLAAIEF